MMQYQKMFLVLPLLAFACGDEESELPGEGPSGSTTVQTSAPNASGDRDSVVDATSSDDWIWLSLTNGGMEVLTDAPANNLEWDIGLRRSNIRLNGGASGSGMGAAVSVPGTELLSSFELPQEGWQVDTAGEDMPDGSPVDFDGLDLVFARENQESTSGWFHYNPMTHVLTPADLIWLVRGAEARQHFALQIVDWYSEAGESAYWLIRWRTVEVVTE